MVEQNERLEEIFFFGSPECVDFSPAQKYILRCWIGLHMGNIDLLSKVTCATFLVLCDILRIANTYTNTFDMVKSLAEIACERVGRQCVQGLYAFKLADSFYKDLYELDVNKQQKSIHFKVY